MEKVNSIQHLKELCGNNSTEFFIALNGGARSSKSIMYHEQKDLFEILNHIENSNQLLTEYELFTESNIGEAIKKQTFYKY